ncbi:topless-related protein 3-like [Camellia sinensis]|uniref:topless-related protein 3-like n=1 Tax=Camellia sinensis TaxID=4442 RepID=UPI0010367CF7|nr:topless-related protein 3-like [Camellia sinensis]
MYTQVARLLYTNSGVGVLALGSNGIQKLWKWVRSEQNPNGKATANVVPQQWQPNSGLLMTNDVTGVNLEEAVPCIALSKNDSYVMSACGGKVSLFNMMTFKVMTTFMPPPPASTFLAFHPQDNNILAIGMEDSTIHIYNVRVDEVKSKLKGHQKRITGLAFSTNLNILVSSGADAQSKW